MKHAGSRGINTLWQMLVATAVALAVPATATGQTGRIHGRIVDAVSGAPVPSASVHLAGTQFTGVTGAAGRFALGDVPAGLYAMEIRHSRYTTLLRDSIRIQAGSTTDLEMQLAPVVSQLEELVVTPGSFSFMGRSGTRQTLSREDIESMPQFGEDIFRAVNRLPGLASGDYSAHFSIRGGRHDETLILLDGLEIHEPYHLKDFNEGAISIVDVEAIENVDLMTGGFSAKYGN